jgi:hypothetical protein
MRIKFRYKDVEIEVEDADTEDARATFADFASSLAGATGSGFEKNLFEAMSGALRKKTRVAK